MKLYILYLKNRSILKFGRMFIRELTVETNKSMPLVCQKFQPTSLAAFM